MKSLRAPLRLLRAHVREVPLVTQKTIKKLSLFLTVVEKLYFLGRVGKNLSVFARLKLYKAIVAPHLEFCTTVLFGLPDIEISKIQLLQNKAMRIILRCSRYAPIVLMQDTLQLMSVRQRIQFKTMMFVYNIVNKNSPLYLQRELQYVANVHGYGTRNVGNLYIMPCSTARVHNSLFCKGLIAFSNFPIGLKRCNNFREFRRLLVDYVIGGGMTFCVLI